MKKEIIVVGVIFILVLTSLSGCNEQSSNGNDNNQNDNNPQDTSNVKVVACEIKSRITIENGTGNITYEDDGFSNKWEQYDEYISKDYQLKATVQNMGDEYINKAVIKALFGDINGTDLHINVTETVTDIPVSETKDVYFTVYESDHKYYDNVSFVFFEVISVS